METIDQRLLTSSPTDPATTIAEVGSRSDAGDDYAQRVKEVYTQRWAPVGNAQKTVTTVTVTIRRDGRVASATILKPSGDSDMDQSVQRTLDHVTFIEPFADGANDPQRTYTIHFSLKAKSGL